MGLNPHGNSWVSGNGKTNLKYLIYFKNTSRVATYWRYLEGTSEFTVKFPKL